MKNCDRSFIFNFRFTNFPRHTSQTRLRSLYRLAQFRNVAMMPIKIECECGQHYAFDVDPVNGRMPSAVACPTCGIDGTAVANDTIARQLGPVPIIRLIEEPPSISAAAPPTLLATASSQSPIALPPIGTAKAQTLAPPAITPSPAVETPTPMPTASPMRLSVTATPRNATETAPAARRPDPRLGLVDRNQAEHEARAKAMWGDSKEQIIGYLMIQGFTLPEATEVATKLFTERTAAVRANGIRKIIIGIGLVCVPIIAIIIFLSIGVVPLKLFAVTIMIGIYGAYLLLKGILMAVAPKSERGDVADQ
jgi:hypothetical protein